jgi:hypothetical protein
MYKIDAEKNLLKGRIYKIYEVTIYLKCLVTGKFFGEQLSLILHFTHKGK